MRSGAGVYFSVSTANLPCWQVEEFVVTEECAPCSNFQAVSMFFLPFFFFIASCQVYLCSLFVFSLAVYVQI